MLNHRLTGGDGFEKVIFALKQAQKKTRLKVKIGRATITRPEENTAARNNTLINVYDFDNIHKHYTNTIYSVTSYFIQFPLFAPQIMSQENASVDQWIANVKTEHRAIAEKVDALLQANIPNCIRLTKWHKPSQPLGVPFYGMEGKSWIVALWSFKNSFGIGFFSGTLLNPEPKIDKMAGPWNKNPAMKARRYDVCSLDELNESQLTDWIQQAIQLPGWGSTAK